MDNSDTLSNNALLSEKEVAAVCDMLENAPGILLHKAEIANHNPAQLDQIFEELMKRNSAKAESGFVRFCCILENERGEVPQKMQTQLIELNAAYFCILEKPSDETTQLAIKKLKEELADDNNMAIDSPVFHKLLSNETIMTADEQKKIQEQLALKVIQKQAALKESVVLLEQQLHIAKQELSILQRTVEMSRLMKKMKDSIDAKP